MKQKLKQKEDTATKQLILSEAVKLFSRKGFNGASMRELAIAADITPGALYYYFPNKKELHEATIIYAYRERSTPAVSSLDDPDQDPMKVLELFIRRLCERFYNDNEFRRLVQWLLLDCEVDESMRKIIIKVVYEKHYDSLTRFLRKLAPDSNPYRLTTFIFGMVMQNYFNLEIRREHKRNFNENNEKPKAVARDIMNLLKNGIFRKG